MKKVSFLIEMLLQKSKFIVAFLVIALFSVILVPKASAAEFNYSDFDFDTYFEEKGNYWTGACNKDEKCIDKIIKTQRKFYTKLYKILAKYAKKGIISEDSFVDSLILETVFINMTPGAFADNSLEYEKTWGDGKNGYTIDDADIDDPEIEPNIDYENITQEQAEYFNDEKDTLKLLISNLFSYTTKCYGIYGSPTVETKSDGTTEKVCDKGTLESVPQKNIPFIKVEKCVDKMTNGLGFWKYYVSKLSHDHFIAKYYTSTAILGLVIPDEYYEQCEEMDGNYNEGTIYAYMDSGELPRLDTDKYFDFLSFNKYFDKKAHLQEYYQKNILKPAKVDCMTKDLCDNSLEKAGLYDTYQDEIIKSRRMIIRDILSILNNYGIKINYAGVGYEFGTNAINSDNSGWWWPIGSDSYYPSEPIPTAITSYFGARTSPTAGASSNHGGIDIAPTVAAYKTSGGDRDVPIVATRDGIVVIASESIKGYGKYIKIQHDNGMFSGYGHVKKILVTNGQSVKQGEVIAIMGNEGVSTGKHLHFEIFTDASTRVNPLDYVSQMNSRPSASSGKFTSGSGNRQSVCLTLKNSGYSDAGIAAILGNIQAESGFNPLADNGTHGGICQWGYGARYEKLKAYRPYDYKTLEGQTLFMMYELQNSFTSLNTVLKNSSKEANELGDDVCMKYEAPGRSECDKRYENPGNLLNYVQNGCN